MEEFKKWIELQERKVDDNDTMRQLQLSCVRGAIAEFNLHNIIENGKRN